MGKTQRNTEDERAAAVDIPDRKDMPSLHAAAASADPDVSLHTEMRVTAVCEASQLLSEEEEEEGVHKEQQQGLEKVATGSILEGWRPTRIQRAGAR